MNIHDIAREAGVSTATVSRVINSPDRVEESTRARVLDVIEAHAYTPNALARGLLHNRTRTIGVLAVDILNPYYATVVHAIERNLSARGNNILLCNTGGSHDEKVRYIRTLLEKRVDGLVFVGSVYREKDGADEILAAARSIPVIMINSVIEAENIHCILCDDRRGIRDALDFFTDAGRERILFINTTTTASARLKEDEFIAHLARRGIRTPGGPGGNAPPQEGLRGKSWIIETAPDRLAELPFAIAAALESDDFNAILASDDLFANVAVNTLHSLHRDIPGSMWVIGYNNSYVSEQTFPRLSSVDSRMTDLGEATAERLTRILSGDIPEDRVVLLEPELILKESTGTADKDSGSL